MRENYPFTDISVSIHRYLIPSQFHASNKCETDQISVSYPIIDQEYKKRKFETIYIFTYRTAFFVKYEHSFSSISQGTMIMIV